MLTRRHASDLLARFAEGAPPPALLPVLGFHPSPLPLPAGHPVLHGGAIARASAAEGPGSRRALLLTLAPGATIRASVIQVARRLMQHAPHHRWLVLIATPDGSGGALAAWRADGGGRATRTRLSAMVVHPTRVLESDAETLMALHAAGEGDDLLVHERWCEILGREALSHRFYRALEHHVVALGEGAEGRASGEARRELALLATSRLLFLSFLQSRGWLDGDADFLARQLDRAFATRRGAHRTLLDPLFFGTLNTPPRQRAAAARAFGRVPFLNGGLFARTGIERRHRHLRFRDHDLGALFDDVFARYRFSAQEQDGDWSERAIDPEMLGRAFESLMASRERRDSGSYYTPYALVARVTDAALEHALRSARVVPDARGALDAPATLPPDERRRLGEWVAHLRVVDPACGSGAFLVHALERMAALAVAAGDPRAPSVVRRQLLTQSIFGVDLNPMAVWLCELRLWLAVVIDLDVSDPLGVPPLPNLDRNVRVGDALAGGSFADERPTGGGAIARLRARYARATGPRKASLARALDREERRLALDDLARRQERLTAERRELVRAARGRDLFGHRRGAVGDERVALDVLRSRARELRQAQRVLTDAGALPFRFATHFADVARTGGFSLVVGNPPWVRLHRIPAERREVLRREFFVFRHAAWQAGAAAAGAAAGFAAQVDLAALFAERSAELLAPGGTLALLLPLKLWRSLAGGGVRHLLRDALTLQLVEDWSEAPAAFDAAVYPSLVVASRRPTALTPAAATAGAALAGSRAAPPNVPASAAAPPVQLAIHRRDLAISWTSRYADLPFDATPGAPWLLLPPPARAAFARLIAAGPSLGESHFGRPLLGVKCGCNDAFVVSCTARGVSEARIAADGRECAMEAALLRPVLRGEQARAWRAVASHEHLIWTHDAAGRPLSALPPLAARWFARWRGPLSRRADLRGTRAWWSLHRIEGAASARPRVVWADVSRGPRACVLPAHSSVVPLNSCYVVPCRDDVDAAALAALLNSPLAAAWLDALAEPARGGFRRYLGWTVARLPIPDNWERSREILAPLGQRGVAGDVVSAEELLDAAIACYRVRASAARTLVEWTWR